MAKITLKAARVNKELTQAKAAQMLGISKKTLQRWENGKSFPTPPKIDAICEVYGVPYDNIIFLK